MSGPRRLAIAVSAGWVIVWWLLYGVFDRSSGSFKTDGFVLIGLVPVVIPWTVWWVRQGFKRA